MPAGRSWTLVILAPCEWITANKLNNRHNRFSRARLTLSWRLAIVECCRAGKLPSGPPEWVDYFRVDAIARFKGRPPVRDRDNLRPTLKAAIDGLTPARNVTRNGKTFNVPGWGLIPDDSDKYLAGCDIVIGEPLARTTQTDHPGLLYLTLTELVRQNALF